MKGCARSCLVGLVGLFVAIAAMYAFLTARGVRPNEAEAPAVGAGILATLAISLLWSARGVLRHRRLIVQALEGIAPVDGQWAGVSGVIRSSSPLTSPISGQSVVAFKYRVEESRGTGKQRVTILHYEGTGLSSPTISTNLGKFRLLAVPEFDMDPSDVDSTTALTNFDTYRWSTTFEQHTTGSERTKSLESEWTDDDGVFRRDIQKSGGGSLEGCRFFEHVIGQGEQVCVLGLYSQSRCGIVPDPNWAHQTKVIRGGGETAIAHLGRRARNYTIWAFVFSGIVVLLCVVALRTV